MTLRPLLELQLAVLHRYSGQLPKVSLSCGMAGHGLPNKHTETTAENDSFGRLRDDTSGAVSRGATDSTEGFGRPHQISKTFGLAHCFVLVDMCLYSLNSSNVPLLALFSFHFCSLPLTRTPQRPPSHQLILSKISPPVIVCPVKLAFTIPAACKSWTRLKMRPSQPLAAV